MTKPINEILPREIDSGIAEILEGFSQLIDEFVNFGTHILSWLIQASKGTDEQMPLIMFVRDMLEKADAISILIKHSKVEPSKVILRSIFELNLYILYLNEDQFLDRSMGFLVWRAKKGIRLNRSFDKEDQDYKGLMSKFKKDTSFFAPSLLEGLPSAKPALENLNSLLQQPEYQKALSEYKRTKLKDDRNPEWYRLFNGPRNIQGLASHLDMPFLYEILYRQWSGNVHSTDVISGKIARNKNTKNTSNKVSADILQLNIPADAQQITSYTLTLMLKTFICLRDKRISHKNEEIRAWYLSVRDSVFKVTREKQFINIEY